MRLYPFVIDGFGFCPTFSHRLKIPRNSLCSISRHAMVLKWANPSYGNIKEEKRRGDTSGQRRCRGSGRKLYASFISVYSGCRRLREQEGGRGRGTGWRVTHQARKAERERMIKTCRWTLRFHKGRQWGKVSENKGSGQTHTHTGKCWSTVPVWEGGEGALIVHKPQMRNPLGLAAPGLNEKRGQRRSAGCPCLCQGMAELAADTQNLLNRTWPGGSTVCTKPWGHSNPRRLASWTTCLVSSHGKCFIHQPKTHTHTHTCLTYSQMHTQYTRDPVV